MDKPTEPTRPAALVVDDYESLRESHARTLEAAGFAAEGLSFERAMALSDDELSSLSLIVLDLHDARGNAERSASARAMGVADRLPWYDRIAGWRLLVRLNELRNTQSHMPRVVVASAVMQIEPDVTHRVYEMSVVEGAFSTIGVASEAEWLEKVRSATAPTPSGSPSRRWVNAIPRWSSYTTLVRKLDAHPDAARFILDAGSRANRPEQKEIDALNASAGAVNRRRDALRPLFRKILGSDLPHA